MSTGTILDVTCYSFAAVGGVLLMIAPFSRSGRQYPYWVRVALFISGPIALAWSFLGFTLLFFTSHLSRNAHYQLDSFKTLLTGVGIGIIALVFIAGGFRRPPRTNP